MTRGLCILGVLLVWPSLALAQDAPRIALEVDASGLDAGAVQQALEADLGIALSRESTPSGPTLRVHDGAGDALEIAFRDGRGRTVSREVARSADPAQGAEIVALVASNLVRDEAGSLLASLQRTAPPRASRPSTPAASSTTPPPVTPPRPPFEACRARSDVPFGVDLFPFVGTSSTRRGRDGVRAFSLNLVGGITRGVHGAELGLALNLEQELACGLGISAGANVVLGPMGGVQMAPLNGAGDVRGAQIGTVNVAAGYVDGAQVSVLNVTTGALRGAQIGAVNVSGDLRGLQLGVVNVAAGEVRGLQLGLVNVAKRNPAPLGLLSIVTHGRTHLELWDTVETGTAFASVAHGGEILYNLYGVGVRQREQQTRVAVLLGLGAHLAQHDWLSVDLEGVVYQLQRWETSPPLTLVSALRVPVGFRVLERVHVVAAPHYSVMVSRDENEVTHAAFGERTFQANKPSVRGWPGLSLGFRIDLQRPAHR